MIGAVALQVRQIGQGGSRRSRRFGRQAAGGEGLGQKGVDMANEGGGHGSLQVIAAPEVERFPAAGQRKAFRRGCR